MIYIIGGFDFQMLYRKHCGTAFDVQLHTRGTNKSPLMNGNKILTAVIQNKIKLVDSFRYYFFFCFIILFTIFIFIDLLVNLFLISQRYLVYMNSRKDSSHMNLILQIFRTIP